MFFVAHMFAYPILTLVESAPDVLFINNQHLSPVKVKVDFLKLISGSCYLSVKIWALGSAAAKFVCKPVFFTIYKYKKQERINKRAEEREKHRNSVMSRRAARQAARKRHRAMRMAPYLSNLNFVLFWPHAKHAHPELYEHWDMNS